MIQIGYETSTAKGEAKISSVEDAPVSNKKNDGEMLQKGHQEIPEESSLFSPAEVAEYQEWLRGRGNFAGVRGSEYDSYDFATLHQLADSGDLHAMHKLAHLYISDAYHKQYGFKAAEDMLMRAALYGSSYALAVIADFKHSQRFSAASELDKRHLTIVSMAYFRAAELRGDYWGSITMRDRSAIPSNSSPTTIAQAHSKFWSDLKSAPVYLAMQNMANIVPDELGQCPKLIFDFSDMGWGVIESNFHCELIEVVRPYFQAIMMVYFAFIGFRVFAGA